MTNLDSVRKRSLRTPLLWIALFVAFISPWLFSWPQGERFRERLDDGVGNKFEAIREIQYRGWDGSISSQMGEPWRTHSKIIVEHNGIALPTWEGGMGLKETGLFVFEKNVYLLTKHQFNYVSCAPRIFKYENSGWKEVFYKFPSSIPMALFRSTAYAPHFDPYLYLAKLFEFAPYTSEHSQHVTVLYVSQYQKPTAQQNCY